MNTPLPFDVTRTPLEPGITLLEASAGTGKTYSLTAVVVRLLVEEKVDQIDRILLVTFTRAAAAELRQRVRRALVDSLAVLRGRDPGGDALLEWVHEHATERAQGVVRLALLQFDRARVTTIHAFCAQLLRDTAFEAGFVFGAEESEDCTQLQQHAIEDQWRLRMHGGQVWWPALAVARGWHLKNFLDDLRERDRHPRAHLHPSGPHVAEIDARVSAAIDALASTWNGSEVERSLTSMKFNTSGKAVSADRVREWLEELGPAPDPRDPAVVEIWLRLCPAQLNLSFTKRGKKWAEVWKNPALAGLVALDEALVGAQHALRLDLIERAGTRFQNAKLQANQLDFDDLVEQVREALEDPRRGARLRERAQQMVRVALIDEFQDTDLSQWEIFHKLFGDSMLLLVGDPKQAIYGFRGADIFAYLNAMQRAQRRYTLPRNHRSHPHLVAGVNALFAKGEDPFVFDRIAFAPVEAAKAPEALGLEGDPRATLLVDLIQSAGDPRLTRDEGERRVLARLTAEIEGLLNAQVQAGDESLHAGHLAVLVRTNAQGRQVVTALRDRGVSAVLSKMGDVHATEAMRELLLVLEAVLDPRDLRRQRRAAATWLWGGTAREVVGLRHDEDVAEATVAQLESLRRIWLQRDFVSMAQQLVQVRGLVERWVAHDEGERLLTDLRHSIELLHAHAQEQGTGPEALVHWAWRETGRDHQRQDDRQLRLEQDRQAVQVVTMHGCKGLEYDVVFVPFAWGASSLSRTKVFRFHGPDDEENLMWEADSESEAAQHHEAERLAEDMRLLYVALTRAKRRCVFFQVDAGNKSSGSEAAASSFLLHRPLREGARDAAWVAQSFKAIAKRREEWDADLEALVKPNESIERLGPPLPPAEQPSEIDATATGNTARPFPSDRRARLWPWRVTSFTGLARRMGPGEETPLADRADPASVAPELELEPEGLFAFARGARAGTCLHEILEHADFQREFEADDRVVVVERLTRHGLADPSAHEAPIDPAGVAECLLNTVRAEPFGDEGFRFADIDPRRRANEWSFRARMGVIDPPRLADLFARHAENELTRRTAERLRTLRPQQLRGFLGGFVDLVFEHDERWFVVDWKSNHLGARFDDYDPAAVGAAMLDHHYGLQYHLYTMALHRYLRARQPGYDYDRHFGGVGYVFLRGLCGRSDRGWFFDRPPRALIDALDRFFDGEGAGA